MKPRWKCTHCSYCGSAFASAAWPRTCGECAEISYLNPVPVGVVLLPVDDGVLCVRRTIEPQKGEVALPGGYLDFGETWQQGCARELREETGIVIDPSEVRLFAAHSVQEVGMLLLFGLAAARRAADLPAFAANDEASETVIVRGPIELAFPFHTLVVREYFQGRRSS
jgi:ADP-ribose pyrophosphatase YjhB (NUDIX family)